MKPPPTAMTNRMFFAHMGCMRPATAGELCGRPMLEEQDTACQTCPAGMKLDAWLAKKGGAGSEGSASKAAAMRRWHRNMSFRDSLVYRWQLYKASATAVGDA